jgi:hypothetical protein
MGAVLGGIIGGIGGDVFKGFGGGANASSWANFVAGVKTGAAFGAVIGGISTAIHGGNVFQNVAMGALSGAVSSAAAFGIMKGATEAWNAWKTSTITGQGASVGNGPPAVGERLPAHIVNRIAKDILQADITDVPLGFEAEGKIRTMDPKYADLGGKNEYGYRVVAAAPRGSNDVYINLGSKESAYAGFAAHELVHQAHDDAGVSSNSIDEEFAAYQAEHKVNSFHGRESWMPTREGIRQMLPNLPEHAR